MCVSVTFWFLKHPPRDYLKGLHHPGSRGFRFPSLNVESPISGGEDFVTSSKVPINPQSQIPAQVNSTWKQTLRVAAGGTGSNGKARTEVLVGRDTVEGGEKAVQCLIVPALIWRG